MDPKNLIDSIQIVTLDYKFVSVSLNLNTFRVGLITIISFFVFCL